MSDSDSGLLDVLISVLQPQISSKISARRATQALRDLRPQQWALPPASPSPQIAVPPAALSAPHTELAAPHATEAMPPSPSAPPAAEQPCLLPASLSPSAPPPLSLLDHTLAAMVISEPTTTATCAMSYGAPPQAPCPRVAPYTSPVVGSGSVSSASAGAGLGAAVAAAAVGDADGAGAGATAEAAADAPAAVSSRRRGKRGGRTARNAKSHPLAVSRNLDRLMDIVTEELHYPVSDLVPPGEQAYMNCGDFGQLPRDGFELRDGAWNGVAVSCAVALGAQLRTLQADETQHTMGRIREYIDTLYLDPAPPLRSSDRAAAVIEFVHGVYLLQRLPDDLNTASDPTAWLRAYFDEVDATLIHPDGPLPQGARFGPPLVQDPPADVAVPPACPLSSRPTTDDDPDGPDYGPDDPADLSAGSVWDEPMVRMADRFADYSGD